MQEQWQSGPAREIDSYVLLSSHGGNSMTAHVKWVFQPHKARLLRHYLVDRSPDSS